MLVSRWLIVTAVILASQAAEAQQPATLTLACQGTVSSGDEKPAPISMGVIVNFNNHTVQGFNTPAGDGGYPVMITGINDVEIAFDGLERKGDVENTVNGTIDRVTGDVWAESRIFNVKGSGSRITTTYTLKCKPTQRMF
jgi:hypothetical protein